MMGSGAAAAMSAQLAGPDGGPGRAAAGRPPAALTRSGIQCPAVNGGSTHSTTATRGRPRPATLAATRARRARRELPADVAVDLAGGHPAGLPAAHDNRPLRPRRPRLRALQ